MRQCKHEGSQNPEHLGRTKRQRVRGHWPGSMWQWDEHEELTQEQKVRTVAFHQQAFGTESPKPTRFLMRMIGMALRDFPKKNGMRVLWRRSRDLLSLVSPMGPSTRQHQQLGSQTCANGCRARCPKNSTANAAAQKSQLWDCYQLAGSRTGPKWRLCCAKR